MKYFLLKSNVARLLWILALPGCFWEKCVKMSKIYHDRCLWLWLVSCEKKSKNTAKKHVDSPSVTVASQMTSTNFSDFNSAATVNRGHVNKIDQSDYRTWTINSNLSPFNQSLLRTKSSKNKVFAKKDTARLIWGIFGKLL